MYPADFKPAKKLKIQQPTKIHLKSTKSNELIPTDDDTSPDEDFNFIPGVPNLLKKIKKTSPRTSTPSRDAEGTPKSPEVESSTPVDQEKPVDQQEPVDKQKPADSTSSSATTAVTTVPAAPVQSSTQAPPKSPEKSQESAPKVPDAPPAEKAVPVPDGSKSQATNSLEDVTPVTTPVKDNAKPGPSSDSGIVLSSFLNMYTPILAALFPIKIDCYFGFIIFHICSTSRYCFLSYALLNFYY